MMLRREIATIAAGFHNPHVLSDLKRRLPCRIPAQVGYTALPEGDISDAVLHRTRSMQSLNPRKQKTSP